MSHTVKRRTQCTDLVGCTRAAQRMGAEILGQGRHKLFGDTHSGLGIKLPQWNYPIVVNLATGEISFDNYNGRWGDLERLNDFKQGYTVEMGKKTAEEKGHQVQELVLPNGEIELQIHIGGGASAAGSGGGLEVGPALS